VRLQPRPSTVPAWFPTILVGAATDGGTASDGAAAGDGPAGIGAGDGDGAAAVGVLDSVGVGEAGESAGLLGVHSGHGPPIGTTPGSTPMSRRPMSSIPIQDKKARFSLWIHAFSLAVERDSHAQPRDIHAPSIAPSNTLGSSHYLGQQKRRDL
jgi:hypothetical protein